MTLALFDAYRDPDARKLMIEYVMASRFVDANIAVDALRGLDHVGLAYLYRDALAAAFRERSPLDYDPCAIGRM
jgi:hypothetical protein